MDRKLTRPSTFMWWGIYFGINNIEREIMCACSFVFQSLLWLWQRKVSSQALPILSLIHQPLCIFKMCLFQLFLKALLCAEYWYFVFFGKVSSTPLKIKMSINCMNAVLSWTNVERLGWSCNALHIQCKVHNSLLWGTCPHCSFRLSLIWML